jgi:hypothetical protein
LNALKIIQSYLVLTLKTIEMKENDKKFIDDWHFYHGKGKWQFILVNGTILAAIAHLLFSLLKFFFLQKVNWENFKLAFFTTTFLGEWLVSTVLLGLLIGYMVWQISDKYYEQLIKKGD